MILAVVKSGSRGSIINILSFVAAPTLNIIIESHADGSRIEALNRRHLEQEIKGGSKRDQRAFGYYKCLEYGGTFQ